jgi:hypothetical protein
MPESNIFCFGLEGTGLDQGVSNFIRIFLIFSFFECLNQYIQIDLGSNQNELAIKLGFN